MPKSKPSAAAAPERPLQRRQTAERIISHGYRSDHLYDRLLAKAGARCLPCALCGGLAAPAFIRPHGRGWKIVGTAPIATIFAEEVASPKSICEWAKSGQGRTFYEQTVLRARNSTPHSRRSSYKLLHCNQGLRGKMMG